MRKHLYYLWFFLLLFLILFGCGKLERKGTPPTNTPPVVHFADIPPEGYKFSINPRIYWWGTDMDGFVTAYQYAVMESVNVIGIDKLQEIRNYLHGIPSDSTSWVNQIGLKGMIGAHVRAEPGGSSRNVMMFADMNDTVYTPQYIFVRAVDNREGVSEIIYRLFSRNNHRPQAFIDMDSATLADFVAKGHYCLPETTATWKGIPISWKGLDTADYKDIRNQPQFQFKWELVGPFASPPTALTVDTTAIVDSSVSQVDSIFVDGKWQPSRWVTDLMYVFKGLENFADSGYGWYQLRLRDRDDAFVSTDTATTLDFRILKPKFRYADQNKKTILVVDATAYSHGRPPDGGAADTVDVRPYYRAAFSQSGLCDEFLMWSDTLNLRNAPSEDVLSRYDLVVVLNLGALSGITEKNYEKYKDYLDIGGRMWLIGVHNWNPGNAISGRDKIHPLVEIRTGAPNAYELATSYFGIEQMFTPTWTTLDETTLEFIRAESFGLWSDLPALEQDPDQCKKLQGYKDNVPVENFGVRGIPHVYFYALSNYSDFANRIPYQRRIYTFISYYGSLSPMHERPCAENYIGSTFRTAEIAFPLNLMKNTAPNYPVYEVIRKMVDWFWEDLP